MSNQFRVFSRLFCLLFGTTLIQHNQALAQYSPGSAEPAAQADRQSDGTSGVAAETTPSSGDAPAVLSHVRKAIFQIKTLPVLGTTPISHGSAFLVTDNGLALTNFHVVSTYLNKSKRHRIEFESVDSRSGSASIVAVSVANDLALLQLENVAGKAPKFVTGEIEKGTTVFSLGFPLNVGFTVTEGIFNGYVKGAIRPLVHYAGALNPGMSGGPTLDGNGRVVGINVSGFRFSQLVNFLVPAKEARALVRRGEAAVRKSKKVSADSLLQQAQDQARTYAENLISGLSPKAKLQNLLGYRVPLDFAPFIECSSVDLDPAGQARLKGLTVACRNNGSVMLESGRQIGNLVFSHTVLHSQELGAWRFAKQMSEHVSASTGFSSGNYGIRLHVGPFRCKQETVDLRGFAAKMLVCARAHRKKPQLYDFQVRIQSLDGEQRGLISQLRLNGAPFEHGLAFIKRFYQVIRDE